ncbi:MAG: ribosomal-protein-serine acetyltransferase [Phenylobacterium sp.]|jgi:ribosomal-protein-serine acetyltransferase
MFTLRVEEGLALTLVEPSFAKHYYHTVCEQRDYLSQWLVWPALADSENFFASFIDQSLKDYANGTSLTCAMVYHGKIIGNIGLVSISQPLKKVEIGYWLNHEYQGKGIVTKSVARLISYAFDILAMEKVEISVAVENTGSRKVCERLKFELEGIISNSENLNGRIVSHAIYGLSRARYDG